MPKSKVRKNRNARRGPTRSKKPTATIEKKGPSPLWYQVLMFGLMIIGVVVIVLNYMGVLPGGSDNLYLVIGLGAIAVGFGMTLGFR